ncbi:hypothetical protein B0I37DRAFT_111516 [Chaetomium sp. MPI-CAGE-AT-0009]|nr:hypothetical protein B0I37DRAFT_111516 [Chaetomium sp. MPI-CAGE-AT-0009]
MASPQSPPTPAQSLSGPSTCTRPTSVDGNQDDTPTIRFTNIPKLFQAIDSVPGDTLVVTNISSSQFAEVERKREERRRFRFRRFQSDTQILVVTIPTPLHERLHLQLYQDFIGQLALMGLLPQWEPFGHATYPVQHNHPGGDRGEGDSTGGPEEGRGEFGSWPTLVIDAGASESLGSLQNDMRWWFHASNHDVKIVILAKFDHPGRAIILEKWEEEPRGIRPGATTTRYAATLEPIRRQHITITQDTTTNPTSYNVTSGALTLGFRLLFLRDPRPGEGDFIFSVQSLQAYAAAVWRFVRD